MEDFLQYLKIRNIPINEELSETKNHRGFYEYILKINNSFKNLFPPQDSRLMGLSGPPGGSEYTSLYNKINSQLNFEKHIIKSISQNDETPFSIVIEVSDKIKGGKKKSTKKRTPTKKRRRHTKRRKPTKRRRSTKRRR